MSLVTTTRSQRSRIVLHSISTSVVLPEPTGPPTPTRSGGRRLVRPGIECSRGAGAASGGGGAYGVFGVSGVVVIGGRGQERKRREYCDSWRAPWIASIGAKDWR